MDHGAIVGRVDGALLAFARSCGLGEGLLSAVEYALVGGGKRLRPVLAWRCTEGVGGAGERSLACGVAVELVHAFSLVHDDLPALDNDDVRRGRPTLHRHAGEAMGVLAGDAMLTMAFEAVERVGEGLDPAVRLSVLREVAGGTRAMIVGQVYDTLGGLDAALTDLQRLEAVHRNKTGALIRAACRGGAILGGADDASLRAITRFSEDLGLIFQIVDDLLDVEGSSEAVGKATGKDAAAGKLTYPGVLGVAGSRAEIERLQGDVEAALAPLGEPAHPLVELSRAMARRDR